MPAAEKPVTPPAPAKSVFDHGHKPVFVLVPFDALERRSCLEALEEEFSKVERAPRVVTELRAGLLPSDAVVFVCHPYSTRSKNAEGRFVNQNAVHISAPILMSQFSLNVQSYDGDGLGQVNVFAITDAITAACNNSRNGRVFVGRLSADKELALKSIKLFNN